MLGFPKYRVITLIYFYIALKNETFISVRFVIKTSSLLTPPWQAGEMPCSPRWFSHSEASPPQCGCAAPCDFPERGRLEA